MQAFIHFARDCRMVGGPGLLMEEEVRVAFTAESVRGKCARGALRPHSVLKMAPVRVASPGAPDKKKLNFEDWLTLLMKLSCRLYAGAASTHEEAFEKLLDNHVRPYASYRAPEDVTEFLRRAEVAELFFYFEDALRQIFTYYATEDRATHASQVGERAPPQSPGRGLGLSHAGGARVPATRAVNTMKEAITYRSFSQFCTDFQLGSNVLLTNVKLGDVFLSSLKDVVPRATIRGLAYTEFCEALLRCALVGYRSISEASELDKLKGLFLHLNRAIECAVPRAWADGRRSTVPTDAGDLLEGSKTFARRFCHMWELDGLRDYLAPPLQMWEPGLTVLERLEARRGGGGGGGGGGGDGH